MKTCFFAVLLVFMQIVIAGESENLTLDKLLDYNYKEMTGSEITEIILDKKIILKDLLSEAEYELTVASNGLTKKKLISKKNPKILTNVEYQARADILSGDVNFIIKTGKVITTDGIRTHISTLYKKDDKIFAVRDVDHDVVNFQIITK